jgi:hypothetical protein
MVASKKRVLRKYWINLMHQVKRCGIKADCHAFNHLHPLVTTQRLKRHGSLEII